MRVNPARRETEALFVQVDRHYRARCFEHGAIVTMEVPLDLALEDFPLAVPVGVIFDRQVRNAHAPEVCHQKRSRI